VLDIDDLRAFQKVATLLSFSEAGRVLSVRKSAVSRSIQRLEASFNVRLFERTTREVALTDAGRALAVRFGEIVSRVDEAVDLAAGLASQPRGRLRLTAGVGFGMEVLTEVLPAFSRDFPDVDVSLDLTSRTVDLVAEEVDAAFRMGAMADSSLVAIRLGAIGRLLVAAPSYLERRGWPKSADDLRLHDVLSNPRGDGLPRRLVLRARDGLEHGVEVSARLSSTVPKAIDRMVLNGAGIGASANYFATPEIDRGNLVRILPEFSVDPVDVSLVLPAGRARSPAARAFVGFVRTSIANNPKWFQV